MNFSPSFDGSVNSLAHLLGSRTPTDKMMLSVEVGRLSNDIAPLKNCFP